MFTKQESYAEDTNGWRPQPKELTHRDKLGMFKLGKYEFNPMRLPATTEEWADTDWVEFINLNGQWLDTRGKR